MHPEIEQWINLGKPIPPPAAYKQETIKQYARDNSIRIFIETGTLHGDTVETVRNIFQKIYSIELGDTLYQKAKERFAAYPDISIIHGDSGKKLPEILRVIKEPSLFWLDAHYSTEITARGEKETPIIEELTHIFNHPYKHIILIDDARLFTGKFDFPTIEELKRFVEEYSEKLQFTIEDDIIRIL